MNSFIVLNTNGTINLDASVQKFTGALLKYQAERELENSTIGSAVHVLFDGHLGKRLPMPYLTGEVLKTLNVQPENYKSLTEKVQGFVRSSPEFHTGKGKGGGVARLCDLTPEQRAKLEE